MCCVFSIVLRWLYRNKPIRNTAIATLFHNLFWQLSTLFGNFQFLSTTSFLSCKVYIQLLVRITMLKPGNKFTKNVIVFSQCSGDKRLSFIHTKGNL